jgi:HTH-type transcriptional regulator/antitoxin HigA
LCSEVHLIRYERDQWKDDEAIERQAMARGPSRVVQHDPDDNYLELVRAFPLRPIRCESELDRAIEVIDSLIARDDLDSGQEDYLDVLGDLVHKYEAEHDPIEAVSDRDIVRFLFESNGMDQVELARLSGIADSRVSEILRGKRKLSRRHIAGLSKVFRVSPAVFFPEPPSESAKTRSPPLLFHESCAFTGRG